MAAYFIYARTWWTDKRGPVTYPALSSTALIAPRPAFRSSTMRIEASAAAPPSSCPVVAEDITATWPACRGARSPLTAAHGGAWSYGQKPGGYADTAVSTGR